MKQEERELLLQIGEQLYGYREVVEDFKQAKDLLDRTQAMAVAIEALLKDDLPKAERLVEKYRLYFA